MEYKTENNHFRVGEAENYTLCNWVYTQRRLYILFNNDELDKCHGTITQERIDKLDKLGFDWVSNVWTENYNLLVEYKKVNKHCRVQKAENKQLANWVYKQRHLYNLFNKGKKCRGMSEERIAKLTKLGFEW